MNLKQAAESYRPVAEKVMKKYPRLPPWRLIAELKRLIEISADSRQMINKRVLDLGCGSKENTDRHDWLTRLWYRLIRSPELQRFDPWYPRIAHEAGAKVVGVDIATNATEEFESRILDLMNPSSLECFESDSFDAANNYCFTVPPESDKARSGTSPAIMYKFEMDFERAYELNRQIFQQVERLLKNGGTYTLAEFVYKKKKGRLKKDHVIEGAGA